jgi:hypothetical protein
VTEREYTLVEIIRDRTMLLCEASELTREGHYYLYRYDGLEGRFYRATVPSGATDLRFRALDATETIPLGGWQVIEKNEASKSHLRLLNQESEASAPSGADPQEGKTSNDGTG